MLRLLLQTHIKIYEMIKNKIIQIKNTENKSNINSLKEKKK